MFSPKAVWLDEQFHIGIGGQTGVNTGLTNHTAWVGYGYANLAGKFFEEQYKTVLGIYTGNNHYLDKGHSVGLMTGFDAGIIYQKLHILGEYATGNND